MNDAIIDKARKKYHQRLIANGILSVTNGIASNADASNAPSRTIAASLANQLGAWEK